MVFPGQASQYVGMGSDVAGRWQAASLIYDIAESASGIPVKRLCFEGPPEEVVLTSNLQVCVVATSLAVLAAAMQEAGYVVDEIMDLSEVANPPSHLAGHSVGEYAALAAAGAIDLVDTFNLVSVRGRSMHEAGMLRPGTMLALLGGSEQEARVLCEHVRSSVDASYIDVANINSNDQTVLAGDFESIIKASELAVEFGFRRAVNLPVSGAFHSTAMLPASTVLKDSLLAVQIKDPLISVYGNIDALPLVGSEAIRKELFGQVSSPVRWAESVANLIDNGVEMFCEIGPGQVLSRLTKRIDSSVKGESFGDIEGVISLASLLKGNFSNAF
tara:strand:+ start:1304 stop:2293 length:990 start_codon:yes stop_codon:yes gene_type:complete